MSGASGVSGGSAPAASGTSGGASGASGDASAGPINLRLADFPSGWAATPVPAPSTTGDPAAASLLTCLHLPPSDRRVVTDTPSAVFSSGATVQAASDVTVVASPTIVGREVAALKAPGGLTCLGQVIGQAVATRGVAVHGATIRAITAPPSGSDPSLGIRYQATFTMQSQSLTVVTDEYFIAHGAEEVTATFTGYEQAFPAGVEQTALAHLVSRVPGS